MKLLPVSGQNMVIENIHEDGAVASELRFQSLVTLFHDRVGIREGIDLSMQLDTELHPGMKTSLQAAFYLITQEGAYQQCWFLHSQLEMSQVIHFSTGSLNGTILVSEQCLVSRRNICQVTVEVYVIGQFNLCLILPGFFS